MRKSLNYTGRKRILQKHITFTILDKDDSLQEFRADIDFSSYELPIDARVWIEAYDKNATMRFNFGTVSDPRSRDDTTLTDFRGVDTYSFRVKVTDASRSSVLLASADNVSPVRHDDDDEPRKSLLRVTKAEIGTRPWQLTFEKADYPLLTINSDIDAGVSLPRSNPFFQSLVFPFILSSVLRKILLEDGYLPGAEPEADDEWREGWLEFSGSLPGNQKLESGRSYSEDDLENWIEDATEGYAASLNAVKKVRVELKEVE